MLDLGGPPEPLPPLLGNPRPAEGGRRLSSWGRLPDGAWQRGGWRKMVERHIHLACSRCHEASLLEARVLPEGGTRRAS